MKLLTLKYLFRMKDTPEKSVCVKYVTDVEEAHKELQTKIKFDETVLGCIFEYVSEIDLSQVGITTTVKPIEKEGNENEKV